MQISRQPTFHQHVSAVDILSTVLTWRNKISNFGLSGWKLKHNASINACRTRESCNQEANGCRFTKCNQGRTKTNLGQLKTPDALMHQMDSRTKRNLSRIGGKKYKSSVKFWTVHGVKFRMQFIFCVDVATKNNATIKANGELQRGVAKNAH